MIDYNKELKRIKKRFDNRNRYIIKNHEDEEIEGGEEVSPQFHGNTRLPFGLCKQYGIEIGDGWTPTDAWNALKEKGINPSEEYTDLTNGKYGESKQPEKEKLHSNASNKAHGKVDDAISNDFDVSAIVDSLPKGTSLSLHNGAKNRNDRSSIQVSRNKNGTYSVTFDAGSGDSEYNCENKECSREEAEDYLYTFYDTFLSYSEEYLNAMAQNKKFHKI